MSNDLTPDVVAQIDQDRALLANMVSRVHDHITEGCTEPTHPCPGPGVLLFIQHMSEYQAKRLLIIATALAGKGEQLWHEH